MVIPFLSISHHARIAISGLLLLLINVAYAGVDRPKYDDAPTSVHEGLDSLCLDDEKSMGYTLRTLGAALWAYWHATSYKEGILKIVLSGGDADTNAAVAGAILGAKFGICHIPDEWKSGLLYASMLHNKVQEFYAMYR